MSTASNEAVGVLDHEAAYATAYDALHSPVFFEKLAADYNITPQTREEAVEMLKVASMLREAEQVSQVKQAQASVGLVGQMRQDLQQLMHGAAPAHSHIETQIKQAAANAAKDPAIAHAILALSAAASVS